MDTQKHLKNEQMRIRKELNGVLAEFKLSTQLSVDDIIDLVYHAGERWRDKAHLQFQKEISKKLSRVRDQEHVFTILELSFQCWNYFPHKDLGKTPFELTQEFAPKKSATKPKTDPKVIVGGREMTLAEYQTMLAEMEKVQIPFKAWLFEKILPAYKEYLESRYKQKTIKKHYLVASILFERILTIGFISPEHVRPDFLYEEFPAWWQTHVMFGDYNETTIENSVMELMYFIEVTTGVIMDQEYIETDPRFWS